MTELKPVKALNDYIAVIQELDIPEGIELPPESLNAMSNEGIVVGLGPESGEGIELGDIVIFRPYGKFLTIEPSSGGYSGKTVILLRKMDLMVNRGKSDKYKFADK